MRLTGRGKERKKAEERNNHVDLGEWLRHKRSIKVRKKKRHKRRKKEKET